MIFFFSRYAHVFVVLRIVRKKKKSKKKAYFFNFVEIPFIISRTLCTHTHTHTHTNIHTRAPGFTAEIRFMRVHNIPSREIGRRVACAST